MQIRKERERERKRERDIKRGKEGEGLRQLEKDAERE
jgi:hypothetical protein